MSNKVIPKIKIEDLDLSCRLYNVLHGIQFEHKTKIETLSDLIVFLTDKKKKEIKIRGFGQKLFDELEAKFIEYGIDTKLFPIFD